MNNEYAHPMQCNFDYCCYRGPCFIPTHYPQPTPPPPPPPTANTPPSPVPPPPATAACPRREKTAHRKHTPPISSVVTLYRKTTRSLMRANSSCQSRMEMQRRHRRSHEKTSRPAHGSAGHSGEHQRKRHAPTATATSSPIAPQAAGGGEMPRDPNASDQSSAATPPLLPHEMAYQQQNAMPPPPPPHANAYYGIGGCPVYPTQFCPCYAPGYGGSPTFQPPTNSNVYYAAPQPPPVVTPISVAPNAPPPAAGPFCGAYMGYF